MRSGKRESRVNGEIKTERINITAALGGEFTNQFFLLLLKLFYQTTDTVIYFFFLVYLVFFFLTQQVLVQQSNIWDTLLQNKDIAV